MSVDTKELCRIAGDVSDEISFSCGEVVYDAAREIRTLRAEVERAASVLSSIAEELGPMGDGDPCPVCHTYSHKGWCWYPALVEWDKQQAEMSAMSKEPPC